jgi:hypothetical protein
MGRLEEAVATFRNAVALAPQNGVIHYNYALALLLSGQLEQGFIEHEWRWQVPQLGLTKRQFPQPRWEGEDPSGKRLLLYCEQGFGDSIQFLRYVPLLRARGAEVIVQLPGELMRLAQSLRTEARSAEAVIPNVLVRDLGIGDASRSTAQHDGFSTPLRFVTFGDPLPDFDCHASLISLPRLMKTTVERIPANVPYLRADRALAEVWRERVETTSAGKLKVGFAWAGRREHWNDRNRSLPDDALKQLLAQDLPVAFFSVQKQPHLPLPVNMIDWTAELNDFADTAALIENLDLIISVDTSVAHLAGAMGKRVWLLLPFAPDWRWLRNRDDSPWYPTMRLFRQARSGDWRGCIETIARELRDFVR